MDFRKKLHCILAAEGNPFPEAGIADIRNPQLYGLQSNKTAGGFEEATLRVLLDAGNLFHTRPANVETDMPQMYDLYNDKTYDTLSKHTNSAMRYKQLVPAPALSYMHDAIVYSEVTLDWLQDEKEPPTVEDLAERVYTAHNTLKGVFALLSYRYTMIQLRGARVIPYMDDFLVLLRSKIEALRELVALADEAVILRSGLTHIVYEDGDEENLEMSMTAKQTANSDFMEDRAALSGRWLGESRRLRTGKKAEGSVACSSGQFGGSPVDFTCSKTRVEARASAGVRSRRPAASALVDLQQGQSQVIERRVQQIHAKDKRIQAKSCFRELEALATEVVIMPRRRDVLTPRRPGGSELPGALQVGCKHVQHPLLPVSYSVSEEGKRAATCTTMPGVPAGTQIEVYWEDDDAFYPVAAVVGDLCHVDLALLPARVYTVVAFCNFGRPETGPGLLPHNVTHAGGKSPFLLWKEESREQVKTRRRLVIPRAIAYNFGVLGAASALDAAHIQLLAASVGEPYTTSGSTGLSKPSGLSRARPQKHYSGKNTSKGAAICEAIGPPLETVCDVGGWAQLSSAIPVHRYIDLTAGADEHMWGYFAG
ncbi:hypothetical protein CYMTET_51270 [Cymbomonas tetramitiformis]|uniref:Uncharacterized protein n=1 Tax=Cymbomonas tetramitiformis TaxID=36881 RepID=A0AAE0ESB4_9CHLO|nr:hypothetical protein CYMTET_51270 [Cymbomonas tetramitiformis]